MYLCCFSFGYPSKQTLYVLLWSWVSMFSNVFFGLKLRSNKLQGVLLLAKISKLNYVVFKSASAWKSKKLHLENPKSCNAQWKSVWFNIPGLGFESFSGTVILFSAGTARERGWSNFRWSFELAVQPSITNKVTCSKTSNRGHHKALYSDSYLYLLQWYTFTANGVLCSEIQSRDQKRPRHAPVVMSS